MNSDDINQLETKLGEIRPPDKLGYAELTSYAFAAADEMISDEPRTYQAAMISKEKSEWKKAMDDEVNSLKRNQTWQLDIRKTVGNRL